MLSIHLAAYPSLALGCKIVVGKDFNLICQLMNARYQGPVEEEITTHTGVLAWEIPWTDKPGGLQSTASLRVGHN